MENIFNPLEVQNRISEQVNAMHDVVTKVQQEAYKQGYADAQVIMVKTKKTFEEYLQDVFLKNYLGTKDGMESSFEHWLENQDIQSLIDMAEDWGKN